MLPIDEATAQLTGGNRMSDIIEITLWVGALLAVFIALPMILAWLFTLRLRKRGNWPMTSRSLVLASGASGVSFLIAGYLFLAGAFSESPSTTYFLRNDSGSDVYIRQTNSRGTPKSKFRYRIVRPGDDWTSTSGSRSTAPAKDCQWDSIATLIMIEDTYELVHHEDRSNGAALTKNVPEDRYKVLAIIQHPNCTASIWHEWDGERINIIDNPAFSYADLAALTAFGVLVLVGSAAGLDIKRSRTELDEEAQPSG